MENYQTTNEDFVPDEPFRPDEQWYKLFKLSTKAREIKGFDPTDFLMRGTHDSKKDGEPPMYLPLEVKRLWFYYWLKEQALTGRIISHEPKITFNVETPNKRVGFVTAQCDIVINGETVSTASAGLAIDLSDDTKMSIAIQSVTGNAESRALSSAGFGCVPKLGPEVDTRRNLNKLADEEESQPKPDNTASNELPYNFSDEPTSDSATPPPSTAPATTVSQQQIVDPALAAQFNALSNQTVDPVAMAKNVVCPINGNYMNQTVGQILASSGGANQLCYFAFKYQAKTAEQTEFQQAVKTVWDSLPDAVKTPLLKKRGLL